MAFFRVVCSVLVAIAVISCAAVTQQSAMRTKTNYDDVWRASLAAVVDIGYAVSSTDSNAGLIVAEQAVVGGGGKVSRLNIAVNRAGDTNEVRVSWIRPPGTLGGGGTEKRYVDALQKRIPDIQVIEAK
jgi:hypothetical protein